MLWSVPEQTHNGRVAEAIPADVLALFDLGPDGGEGAHGVGEVDVGHHNSGGEIENILHHFITFLLF